MTTTTSQNKLKFLITGSEGSLAQWMIKHYLIDCDITGIDNHNRYGKIDRIRDYSFFQVDLCDLKSLEKIFDNQSFDYVFHCAAQIYGVKGFHLYPADILSNNTVSTSNLLKCCVKNKVKKVVYISSSMVYEKSDKFPLKEEYTNFIPTPSTAYGLSKLVGERLVQEYSNQYGLVYVIWRPFNIVTPEEYSEDEPGIAHVMADFIKKICIERNNEIEIFGDGEQTRCFTYIDDVAKIIANKSLHKITNNEIYNIGSETPTKIIDLAKLIFSIYNRTGEFKPIFLPTFADDVINRVPDCSKSRTIGFTHTKTIDELVRLCIR